MANTSDGFYPCNEREANILRRLKQTELDDYIRLRHAGASVTEAITAVGDSHRILATIRMLDRRREIQR